MLVAILGADGALNSCWFSKEKPASFCPCSGRYCLPSQHCPGSLTSCTGCALSAHKQQGVRERPQQRPMGFAALPHSSLQGLPGHSLVEEVEANAVVPLADDIVAEGRRVPAVAGLLVVGLFAECLLPQAVTG